MDNNNQPNPSSNGLSIASLVLGIISVIFSFLFVWVGLVSGIIGIVLAIKGRKESKNGMAIAGLVLSIIGTCLSGVFIACALCIINSVNDVINNSNDIINNL